MRSMVESECNHHQTQKYTNAYNLVNAAQTLQALVAWISTMPTLRVQMIRLMPSTNTKSWFCSTITQAHLCINHLTHQYKHQSSNRADFVGNDSTRMNVWSLGGQRTESITRIGFLRGCILILIAYCISVIVMHLYPTTIQNSIRAHALTYDHTFCNIVVSYPL